MRDRLRILYLHQHFSTPAGSTATRSHAQAAALAEAGHAVTVACGRYAGAVSGLAGGFRGGVRQGQVSGFTVREFDIACGNAQPLAARAGAFLRYAARATALALGDWDVVVASSTPLTVALPALAARWRRGTPFVFEVRDPWPELPAAMAEAGHIPRPVLAAMDRLADAACRRAAAVVALTEGIAATAERRGAAAVHVLPQGADLGLFGPHVSPWRPPGGPFALYAGAHGRANGLDQLLDAAALLRGGALRLLLVGEGSEKPRLMARVAREGLPVEFLDPLPKPSLAGLLAGAEMALLCLAPVPAFAEWTAPNKLAEAMASGQAVVSNVPGRAARVIAEAGCGVTTPPGDAAALAHALRDLGADPARRAAMGRAGRAAAERDFGQQAIARRFVAVVEGAARR